MDEKIFGLLGLMRRAGKIELGEMSVTDAVKGHRVKLLLLADDAGRNARHRAEGFAERHGIPLAELPLSKEEFSQSVGKANTAMAAVTDEGFALTLAKSLGDRYADIYKRLSERQRRASAGRRTSTGRSNA